MQRTRTTIAGLVVVGAMAWGSLLAASVPPARAAVTPLQPDRVLDTRVGLGAAPRILEPGTVIALPLPNARGVDAAVSLNLTATEAAAAGYLTAWPCGQPRPSTSVLNFVPQRTSANFVAVGVGDGGVCLSTSAPVHVVADLMGTFAGGQELKGEPPVRLVDTRTTNAPLSAGVERRLRVAAPAGAVAAALNVTVVGPAADGYVTAYPCGTSPLASTVNFRARDVVATATFVRITGGE